MSLQCWKCGASLAGRLLPLSRRDTCPSSRAELHVAAVPPLRCGRAGQCRELAAERVADKTRVNDCGWFVPRPEAYKGGGAAMAQASRGRARTAVRNDRRTDDAPQTRWTTCREMSGPSGGCEGLTPR